MTPASMTTSAYSTLHLNRFAHMPRMKKGMGTRMPKSMRTLPDGHEQTRDEQPQNNIGDPEVSRVKFLFLHHQSPNQ